MNYKLKSDEVDIVSCDIFLNFKISKNSVTEKKIKYIFFLFNTFFFFLFSFV